MTDQVHTITLGNLTVVILRHQESNGRYRYTPRLTAERLASIRLKTLAQNWIVQQMSLDSAARKQPATKGQ